MHTTEGVPHPVTDPEHTPCCPTCETLREDGGSTCGDCGAFLALAGTTDDIDRVSLARELRDIAARLNNGAGAWECAAAVLDVADALEPVTTRVQL